MEDLDIEFEWNPSRQEWMLRSQDGETFGHDTDREAALIAFILPSHVEHSRAQH